MLEAGGVGGVAGDGDLHSLLLHDGNALQHIVGAIALHGGALAVREGLLTHDGQLAGFEVVVCLHIGEAVDAADDIGGILAKAVQDDAQGLFAGLVGGAGNADSALGGGEGFMPGQEGEALGLVAQKHGAQVAVAQAHLALLGHRAGHSKGLQPLADGGGAVGGAFQAALHGNGGAEGIGPHGVVEADGLHALHDGFHIDALFQQHGAAGVERFEAVGRQTLIDFGHAAFLTFKCSHDFVLLYSSRGSMYLGASAKRP